jgi:spermidine/putrescine transport system substrate-binding protein
MRYYQLTSLALFVSFSFQLQAETITLLNWDAYLSEQVKTQWENKTSNQIDIIAFDNDGKRDAILLNSKNQNIDIAVVDEIIAERFGKEGRFLKITEANVPNLKHTGKFWRQRCGEYAAPYLWGTLGIIYRSDIVKSAPTSWKEILEPSSYLQGHVGMLADYTDMLAPALFLNGHPLNTENPKALKQAFESLKAQIPFVLTYDYPITYLQSNAKANDLYMAVSYGGDQFSINKSIGKEGLWKYTVPQEGTVLWVDCLAIPTTSKQKENALAFINYLNQPMISAQNADELYYATPNETALQYISPIFRNNKEIYPEHEILQKSGLYEELSNINIKQRLRISNAIINIHESKQTR